MTPKICPTIGCGEPLELVWNEDLGQIYICKNSHEYEFDYSKSQPKNNPPGDLGTPGPDSGPPLNEKDSGKL